MKIATVVLAVVAALGGSGSASAAPSLPQALLRGESSVDSIKAKIACFVSIGILKPTCASLLTNTLTAAQNRQNQGNTAQAVALLNNFILYVNRFEAAGQLPCWAANCLRSMALDLIFEWQSEQEN